MPSFSRDLERTLHRALAIAGERGAIATPVHLALALAEDVFVGELLRACAVDPEALRARLRLMAGPALDGLSVREAAPDVAVNRIIQRAVMTAQAARRDQLGPPQMLVALMDERDEALSTAFRNMGLTRYDAVRYMSHGLRKAGLLGDAAMTSGEADSPYVVKLFNDDHTPMEFVVSILRNTFDHSQDDAVRCMLEVHRRGTAECGTYPRSVAAAKLAAVEKLARDGQHPLHCVMEPKEV